MIRRLVTFLVLSGTWVLWSWHFEPLIVGFGLVSVLFVLFVISKLDLLDAEGQPYEINLRLLGFIPWLVWQVIVANVQVAKLILSPKMPIRPHLIRVPATQRTSIGRVIYANTITITPGTISLDVRDDVILVHALCDSMADEDSAGQTARVIRWLEAKVSHDIDTTNTDPVLTSSSEMPAIAAPSNEGDNA